MSTATPNPHTAPIPDPVDSNDTADSSDSTTGSDAAPLLFSNPAKGGALDTHVPLHLPGLGAVETVATTDFAKTQLVLGNVVTKNGIGAVYGSPGRGKTFSVDYFLHTHSAMRGRVWHWLNMPPKPTTKEVTQRLMTGVGAPFSRRDTEYQLTEDLVPHLNGSGLVVVLDEAQNLRADGLQQLRYFHDRGRSSWTLLLVGSTVDRALSGAAELDSRVAGWVHFTPMEGEKLLRAVRDWHPVMRDFDPKLLLRVDEVYAHGNWRRWGQFLSTLLDILRRQPAGTVLTQRHVNAALAVVQPN